MTCLDSFEENAQAVVIAASGGIGAAITDLLAKQEKIGRVYAFSRSDKKFNHPKITSYHIDILDEKSIEEAKGNIEGSIDIIINAAGLLHDEDVRPEKSLRDLRMDSMQKTFLINIFGPSLLAKHFIPLLPRDRKSVFAALSARVGSISDNKIGGWYSYRASKAALNMVIKTASIEVARRYKKAAIIGLHPGTVDTKLSNPFQNNIQHSIFSSAQSAEYLIHVVDQVSSIDSGKVFSWDGKEIPC
jgi:NAD(P)-dependent dehydrogenase (short-subunit alcohol dehydrogenase family)